MSKIELTPERKDEIKNRNRTIAESKGKVSPNIGRNYHIPNVTAAKFAYIAKQNHDQKIGQAMTWLVTTYNTEYELVHDEITYDMYKHFLKKEHRSFSDPGKFEFKEKFKNS